MSEKIDVKFNPNAEVPDTKTYRKFRRDSSINNIDKAHPPSYERADFYCVEMIKQPSFWWRESVVVTMN